MRPSDHYMHIFGFIDFTFPKFPGYIPPDTRN